MTSLPVQPPSQGAPVGDTILVVDDEPQMRQALQGILAARGYDVRLACSGGEALELAAGCPPAAVVLDLSMPGIDGFETCKQLRSWCTAPILVLSVRSEPGDKIRALDVGADDYVSKPFVTGELLARIKALLRRSRASQPSEPVVRVGALVIDYARRKVTRDGEPVVLTRTEFEILSLLARNIDRVATTSWMMEQLWGPPQEGDIFKLRVHVGNLRKKLEPNPSVPQYVVTEPGVGYCLTAGG